jgi:hypothetical protein
MTERDVELINPGRDRRRPWRIARAAPAAEPAINRLTALAA